MNKSRHSLSRSIGLGIVLMAVPIFMLSLGVYYMQSRKLFHQEAALRSNSILNTALQRAVNYMNAVETAAKANAWLLEENFTPDSLQAITHRIVTRNRSVISCSVGTEPGLFPQIGPYISVYTVNNGDTVYTVCESDYEYFDKMWYQTVRKSNKACWINPFSDYNEATLDYNEAVASYCMPLHAGGRIAGVFTTNFSFSTLARNIKGAEPPYPNAYFMLLGSDGRYLIHPNEHQLFKKTIFADAADDADLIALGHEMTAGKSGTTHATLGGEECHVVYSGVPDTNWSLALVIPSDEMMSSYNRMGYIILVLIFIGLIAIYLLAFRVVRQTITPINRLLDVTEKITNGHYDEAIIPLSDKKDAVAHLQNSFSAMQQSIVTNMSRIEHTAHEIGEYNLEENEKVEKAEEAIRRKDEFVSQVLSHVKSPLETLRECSYMLRDSLAIPDPELQRIAAKMNHSAVTLHRRVLMLFDVSDNRNSDAVMYKKSDDTPINQVAHDSVDYIQGLFGLNIGFETELPGSFRVKTNRLYVMNTLRELLYNAAKYSDGQHILLRITETPKIVRFTIQDVGPGLPLESMSLDKLFKPFVKVDEKSEGLGLGLPLCKRHAERLGGNLTYDEDYKEGCRFFFDIPK